MATEFRFHAVRFSVAKGSAIARARTTVQISENRLRTGSVSALGRSALSAATNELADFLGQSAGGEDRTLTSLARLGILSPVRLPVSPPRPVRRPIIVAD